MNHPTNEPITHICPRAAWEAALAAGVYRAASLASEGFIHCSRQDQVLATANRFYAVASDLVLLWIDPARLNAEVRWEPADGDVFPHVYGVIDLNAVLAVTPFEPDANGVYRRLPER